MASLHGESVARWCGRGGFTLLALLALTIACSARTPSTPAAPSGSDGAVGDERTAALDGPGAEPAAADAHGTMNAAEGPPRVDAAEGRAPVDGRGGEASTICQALGDALLGTVCSDLALSGGCVVETFVAGRHPDPSGGTPVDGSYDLVAMTTYTGSDSPDGLTPSQQRKSLRLSGQMMDTVIETYFGLSYDTLTLTFSGTQVQAEPTCSFAALETWGYTASGDTFEIIGSGPPGTYPTKETFQLRR
jgi:hypothetical protein